MLDMSQYSYSLIRHSVSNKAGRVLTVMRTIMQYYTISVNKQQAVESQKTGYCTSSISGKVYYQTVPTYTCAEALLLTHMYIM